MPRPLVPLLLLALGCSGPLPSPCAEALASLQDLHTRRIHGLTQNHDVGETLDLLEKAAGCPGNNPLLLAHASLLRARLSSKGLNAELLALARILGADKGASRVLAEVIREDLRRGGAAAQERLSHHAQILTRDAGDKEPARTRALLASQAWDGHAPPEPALETVHFVNHVSDVDSCVSLMPGRSLPTGMAMFAVERDGRKLPLVGDSPATPLSPDKPPKRPLWFCTPGPWKLGDLVSLEVGGRRAWSAVLSPTANDVARGVAVARLRNKCAEVPRCKAAGEADARVACDLLPGGGP